MKSFFFVPANSKKYLSKIDSLNSNEIIIELEDGIPSDEIEYSLSLLKDIKDKDKLWIRPKLDYYINETSLLIHLLNFGFKKIILPKIKNKNHFFEISSQLQNYDNLNIIILVEYPKLLLELETILSNYKIYGLAFGMHDFAREFGVKPNHELFSTYAKQILLISKAFGIKYIDSPSMQLSNDSESKFKEELLDMKNLGADGKFLIHPKQLIWFNNIDLYYRSEIDWALSISNKVNIYDNKTNHKTIIIDNEIIEKPHIELAIKILEWNDRKK